MLQRYLAIALVVSAGLFSACGQPNPTGTLMVYANGEERLSQGWTSKDGWQLTIDHAYLTVGSMTAYQTQPPFDPQTGSQPEAIATVEFPDAVTVDLVADDPPLLGSAPGPVGHFNALAWQTLDPTLQLVGTARRGDVNLLFNLTLNQPLQYLCGEYIGEERKGILAANETTALEITLHFDHLFGDGAEPPTAEINQAAFGFEPLAALAIKNQVNVDQATLQERLSAADYKRLLEAMKSLGHVGEGHCREVSS
ncbi:hypothetical protein RYO59_002343 [Thermosynechococcaceae cyanobacterium Okahandja]